MGDEFDAGIVTLANQVICLPAFHRDDEGADRAQRMFEAVGRAIKTHAERQVVLERIRCAKVAAKVGKESEGVSELEVNTSRVIEGRILQKLDGRGGVDVILRDLALVREVLKLDPNNYPEDRPLDPAKVTVGLALLLEQWRNTEIGGNDPLSR